MPVQTTYPGVYIEEIPSGVHTITGVATSITAFIGRALFGPVNQPTVINSWRDYERNFGGLWYSSTMSYAVNDFFGNGGNQAVIVRLYNEDISVGPGIAQIVLPTAGGSPPGEPLTLVALDPGAWANKLYAEVDYNTQDPTAPVTSPPTATDPHLFNLRIYQKSTDGSPDQVQETYLRVSINPSDTLYLPRVLQQNSTLFSVSQDATGNWIVPGRPMLTSETDAKGGSDGIDLTFTQYEGDPLAKTGIYALEMASLFNLLCIPPPVRGTDTPITTYQKAMTFCANNGAVLIVDPPIAWAANPATAVSRALGGLSSLGLTGVYARNAVLYFPRVLEADPLWNNQLDTFVPCGIMAGIMARTDSTRGVWKSPAGIDASLNGISGLQYVMTDAENGQLNPVGINCFRTFPITGTVAWGARTMRGADQLADDYKYLAVRRTALFLEKSLYQGTQWVVFEPNDETLWAQIRLNIGAFMQNLFLQGAFQGSTPQQAYLVKCDAETTTQNDIDQGIVNIIVAFAPLKPAEFVIIQIQQLAGQVNA
ncbi:phage tail sheath family protein [Puia dinghuensis]|uniref:Tail protein n=1 Tax=Puia dinghuensis TaxID=1792502 RepID=A0A8J2UA16_9BACT|nr:phage tail sheath C-terminal domain-containing protein [Puia dinghuensis]GGA88745.1 tail protein [Puia dinghuensis]